MAVKLKHLLTKTLSSSSAEQLTTDTSLFVPSAYLQADRTNVGFVTFGDSTLSSGDGAEFGPGEGPTVGSGDPNKAQGWVRLSEIYAQGTPGDKVRILLEERT